MANINHLRIVYLNEFLHSVEKALNHTRFEYWEDPTEEKLDSVQCAFDSFNRKLANAHTKNKKQQDRATHTIVNTTKRTSKCNRLSPKRRKAKKTTSMGSCNE